MKKGFGSLSQVKCRKRLLRALAPFGGGALRTRVLDQLYPIQPHLKQLGVPVVGSNEGNRAALASSRQSLTSCLFTASEAAKATRGLPCYF